MNRAQIEALAEPWRSHFIPLGGAGVDTWEPIVRVRALDVRVLAVARTRIEGAWCAYVGAVPGDSHKREFGRVLEDGAKLSEAVARAIFPTFEGVPYAE